LGQPTWTQLRAERERQGANIELCTCLAYGVDLNLAQLVFVNTAASVLSA
jgi:hypothetical protein